jgi:hypothetical protein
VEFIREVATYSSSNCMDIHNLSLLFAPTIFRFEMTDLFTATADVKLVQVIMKAILQRPSIVHRGVKTFKDTHLRAILQQPSSSLSSLSNESHNNNQHHSNHSSRHHHSGHSHHSHHYRSTGSGHPSSITSHTTLEDEILSNPILSSPQMRKELDQLVENSTMTHTERKEMAVTINALSPKMLSRMKLSRRTLSRGNVELEADAEAANAAAVDEENAVNDDTAIDNKDPATDRVARGGARAKDSDDDDDDEGKVDLNTSIEE